MTDNRSPGRQSAPAAQIDHGPSEDPFDRPFGRIAAWLELLILDHGFLRLAYRHWHEVAPGLYRSNQPAPFQVRRAARSGIRTVVNLRRANASGRYLLEREAAAKAGIAQVDFFLSSRGAPRRQQLLDAAGMFDRIDYPALIHCKSGIDRTGLMGALYILVRGGAAGDALKQFGWRYGYIGAGPTGIGKALVLEYGRAQAETGVDFLAWVAESYDPAALEAAFRPRPLATALVDFVLRRE
ncbi:MAG: protein tyrosine phosphatase [Rhodospirillaceae bacterium]|nr:protein tyrosine phosphatase [Rhodospirillaceae bacterium]MYF85277.1 protein tyrosine phosphatase [Rhodospirillaceae bacterium]MYH37451.1 protein tyrosine phosphatase [Rhodospirillaceae bacterium]MYK14536.1 protein tyrosine phosphatase [Rhodospirillaceae bacterium]MYK57857.1 protein tyrosine phosphatase [Rhodospirillaceae bacterium]